MTPREKLAAGLAAVAIAAGAGAVVVGPGGTTTTTTTTTTPACPQSIQSSGQGGCTADKPAPPGSSKPPESEKQAPQSLGVIGATSSNGNLPSSALAPATGCTHGLAKTAAAAWNHVAVVVHDHTGYWLQSNGDASCYRTFQQQVDLRNYWCQHGNCGNAAVPGTSNHGWGLAVDAPPQTVAYIHQYSGGLFGQGNGSCSDAPWESWHVKYCGGYSGSDPGPYGSGGGHAFHVLHRGSHGPRVYELTTHLALLNDLNSKRPHYMKWSNRGHRCHKPCAYGIRKLQHDGKLTVDGKYGRKTARYQRHRWNQYTASH